MRRILLSIGAAAALAAAALPTTASAQRHWGGPHFGFRGPGFAFGFGVPGPSYYDYVYNYGPDCYRVERVWTPYGMRVRLIWVC